MTTRSIFHGLRLSVAVSIAVSCVPAPTHADVPPAVSKPAERPAANVTTQPQGAVQPRDGQRDFDFLFGTWKVHVRRLKNPLHGSNEWYEMFGTSVVRPIWGGKAHVEEIQNDGPNGRTEAVMVRLYSPASGQWSLYWATQKNAHFDVPTVGEFKDGKGEFYDQEMYDGRAILVRFVWSDIKPKSAHFEQAFSADGGKTWEVNWIAQCTRAE